MAYKHKAYLGNKGNKNASANKSKRAGHTACLINTKDIGLIPSTVGKYLNRGIRWPDISEEKLLTFTIIMCR